jgi:hypothetical protein
MTHRYFIKGDARLCSTEWSKDLGVVRKDEKFNKRAIQDYAG